MTLSDADGFEWQGVFNEGVRPVTPFGYEGEVYTQLLDSGRGTLSYYLASSASTDGGTAGKAPIPTGSTGTLTLTAYSGQTYSFNALLHRADTGANQSTNDPQVARYAWVFSAATPLEVLS